MIPGARVGEIIRFLLAGGSTTLLSYLLYLALLLVLRPTPAYAIAYLAGFIWSFVVNTRYVFRAEASLAKLIRFPLVYAAQAVVSIGLFSILERFSNIDQRIIPLAVILATVPLTYLLSRRLLSGRAITHQPAPGAPPDA